MNQKWNFSSQKISFENFVLFVFWTKYCHQNNTSMHTISSLCIMMYKNDTPVSVCACFINETAYKVLMSFMLLPHSQWFYHLSITPMISFVRIHRRWDCINKGNAAVRSICVMSVWILCVCLFNSLSIMTIFTYWCVQKMTRVENPREFVVCNMNISSVWFNMSLTGSYRTESAIKMGFCTQCR